MYKVGDKIIYIVDFNIKSNELTMLIISNKKKKL